jgi:hypothetical protein
MDIKTNGPRPYPDTLQEKWWDSWREAQGFARDHRLYPLTWLLVIVGIVMYAGYIASEGVGYMVSKRRERKQLDMLNRS